MRFPSEALELWRACDQDDGGRKFRFGCVHFSRGDDGKPAIAATDSRLLVVSYPFEQVPDPEPPGEVLVPWAMVRMLSGLKYRGEPTLNMAERKFLFPHFQLTIDTVSGTPVPWREAIAKFDAAEPGDARLFDPRLVRRLSEIVDRVTDSDDDFAVMQTEAKAGYGFGCTVRRGDQRGPIVLRAVLMSIAERPA